MKRILVIEKGTKMPTEHGYLVFCDCKEGKFIAQEYRCEGESYCMYQGTRKLTKEDIAERMLETEGLKYDVCWEEGT